MCIMLEESSAWQWHTGISSVVAAATAAVQGKAVEVG